jgi:hypothetical protein
MKVLAGAVLVSPRRQNGAMIQFNIMDDEEDPLKEEQLNGDYAFGDWTERQLVTDAYNTFFQWLVATVTVEEYTKLEDFNELSDLLQRSASAAETGATSKVTPELLSKK